MAPIASATVTSAAAPAIAACAVATAAEAALLRAFDLHAAYGPCLGLSRLQRWRRAARLGLGPPTEVLAILERVGETSPEARSLWAAYPHLF